MSRGGRNRRKPAPRQRSDEVDVGQQEPVRITRKSAGGEDSNRIVLFWIEDEPYSVPKTLPPAIGLRYMRNLRRQDGDHDLAVAELLTEAMGEDAFNALADCDDLEQDQMEEIITRVLKITIGANPGKAG